MHSVRVPLSPASAAVVRHQLVDELASCLPADVLDDAALVVSELVGNAVRHGRPLPGGGLLARWELGAAALRVEVVDGGDGPPAVPPPHAPATAEGGRGLELVGALASRWGRDRAEQGTAVWAELSSGPPAHDAGPGARVLRLPEARPLPVLRRRTHGSRVLRLP